jgi:hypothetical protein
MPELIPFRWPVEWKDASRLELLKGTPINCLVGDAPPPFSTGDLQFFPKDRLPAGIAVRDGAWPRVLPAETKKDAAEAGATGAAWVDSNAGLIRLAQTMEPGKPVWLTTLPPGGKEVVPLEEFARAVAEACAYGARWIVTLDGPFRAELEKPGAAGLREWKRVVSALNFFERHSEWRSWGPVAALAVVSDFEGDNKLMAEEFLILAPRRHLAYGVIRKGDAAKASLSGFKAILWLDGAPPAGELREKCLEFARAGGLLISPSGVVAGEPLETFFNYQIHRLGKGRVAVPKEAWYDPFLLVAEVQILLGNRENVVQVWNGGSMNSHLLASPNNDRAVAHLIQYSSGRSQAVTLGFSKPYRSARVYTLDSEKVVRPVRGGIGIEVPVGEFSGYAAVELEA